MVAHYTSNETICCKYVYVSCCLCPKYIRGIGELYQQALVWLSFHNLIPLLHRPHHVHQLSAVAFSALQVCGEANHIMWWLKIRLFYLYLLAPRPYATVSATSSSRVLQPLYLLPSCSQPPFIFHSLTISQFVSPSSLHRIGNSYFHMSPLVILCPCPSSPRASPSWILSVTVLGYSDVDFLRVFSSNTADLFPKIRQNFPLWNYIPSPPARGKCVKCRKIHPGNKIVSNVQHLGLSGSGIE